MTSPQRIFLITIITLLSLIGIFHLPHAIYSLSAFAFSPPTFFSSGCYTCRANWVLGHEVGDEMVGSSVEQGIESGGDMREMDKVDKVDMVDPTENIEEHIESDMESSLEKLVDEDVFEGEVEEMVKVDSPLERLWRLLFH
ncbi:hypothetical protein TREMEDRAFT_64416 [Tremella mesenterica DSM 1558]|uniref:uncharacterized protein n=1 Tax=Tremella mesenterica (strain ATCC 24925 / CBS 8224 / DSM 1558 / NBRC 9311 / NRRL Y-6157 / RJB 2259-6 / UBC 559-6) TaxID=578456 RepID=UPI0003F49C9B|nr:uncharacterized protein TREMEDRAFT_64416 [Tremella mesenterica DSM 1558]EIW67177.1 hypothetical protein TREMEDRAFT_64416 [Tremella mesenterica DSM 1558]